MDENAIISPKPLKKFSHACVSLRKNHLSKIPIEKQENASSSKTTEKKSLNDNFHNNLTCATDNTIDFCFKTDNSHMEDINIDFFKDYDSDLTKQMYENEILSIVSCENKQLKQEEFTKDQETMNFNNVRDFNLDDVNTSFKTNVKSINNKMNFRASMPPTRPKNPFFKNFQREEDIKTKMNSLVKCLTEDF
jgi:hypothetical protein